MLLVGESLKKTGGSQKELRVVLQMWDDGLCLGACEGRRGRGKICIYTYVHYPNKGAISTIC